MNFDAAGWLADLKKKLVREYGEMWHRQTPKSKKQMAEELGDEICEYLQSLGLDFKPKYKGDKSE